MDGLEVFDLVVGKGHRYSTHDDKDDYGIEHAQTFTPPSPEAPGRELIFEDVLELQNNVYKMARHRTAAAVPTT